MMNGIEADNTDKKPPSFFTYEQVVNAVAAGRLLVIFDSKVYDCTKWVKFHPGGELPIRHVLGKDATDQMSVMHSKHILRAKLPNFYVGDMIEGEDCTPPPSSTNGISLNDLSGTIPMATSNQKNDGKKQFKKKILVNRVVNTPLSLAFRKFAAEIEAEGFYETDYVFYYLNCVKFVALFAATVCCVLFPVFGEWISTVLAALFCGALWQQMAFVVHDGGHNGITHDRKTDSFIGVFLANYWGGISLAWWKYSHNTHHVITNDVHHDPDIQHLPFFAVSTHFFRSPYSTYHKRTLCFDTFARFIIPFQHYLYYPVMMFARFNLYFQSFKHLATERNVDRRKTELAGLAFFWLWLSVLMSQLPSLYMALLFLAVSHALTFILHVQITLSHFCMCTQDSPPDEEFVRHQLRTTLDVDCPEWMDWFHGGLQFQTSHHLFPRVPRHNLRKLRTRVVEFCNRNGLQYNCESFMKGNGMVLGTLKEVADQVRFCFKVAVENAKNEYSKQLKLKE